MKISFVDTKTKEDLGEAVLACVYVALVLLLIFLFKGTPSVWDKLHDRTIKEIDASCVQLPTQESK